MKKIKVIAGWIFVITIVVTSLNFVENRQKMIPCHYVKIEILDSLYNGFVTRKDLLNIIHKNYSNILGTQLSLINTEKLEKAILDNRAVKKCDIYKTPDGTLYVEVLQRQPVLRVINYDNVSYYIDQDGFLIPFTSVLTPNVLVATGNIVENHPFNISKYNHVTSYNMDKKENILTGLYKLGCYVNDDPFWRAQFLQIYVDKKGELELIPRVGAHIIILGKTDNYERKLKKLKALYIKGLNNIGWNNYETINLKYKNQVICSKR